MTRLTWLADVLREAGCKVVEAPGWKERGLGDMGTVKGWLVHHTAGSRKGNSPSLDLVLNGRADLRGPLSQTYVARDGTWHVLAAGRCNHAGNGTWHGATGNSQFGGTEAENAGTGDDPWSPEMIASLERGIAAIILKLGVDPVMAAGHKEYCTPRGRKIDPAFDMPAFRANLEDDFAFLKGVEITEFKKVVVNNVDPKFSMLRKGDRGKSVELLQGYLKVKVDGQFGPATEAAVKSYQAKNSLTVDGLVGPKTWKLLEAQQEKVNGKAD